MARHPILLQVGNIQASIRISPCDTQVALAHSNCLYQYFTQHIEAIHHFVSHKHFDIEV